MADPLFWLALSFLLVVIALTAVLMTAIPALRELGRAARSAEKLFDTLGRELPPTLESIRLTSLEITELTDDVTEGVQGAGQVVQQVSQSLGTAQSGADHLSRRSRSVWAGARVAWRTFTQGDRQDKEPARTQGAIAPPDRPLEADIPPRSSLKPTDKGPGDRLPAVPFPPQAHRDAALPFPETSETEDEAIFTRLSDRSAASLQGESPSSLDS